MSDIFYSVPRMNLLIPFIISPTDESIHDFKLYERIQALSQDFRGQTVDEKNLKNIGLALWTLINRTQHFSKFSNAHALIIQSDSIVMHNLPWECLYHPEHGFLAKHPHFTLSHCLPNVQKIAFPFNASPLKILHFTAQPSDLKNNVRLDIEIEQYLLENTLNSLIQEKKVYFHSPNDGRFATLKNLLQESWHLVILTGHNFSAESPYFLFENDEGQSHAVSTEILAQTFKNQHIQCVLLSACESGKNGLNNNSLAIQLLKIGIPHTIGMRESVMDRAGSIFVQAFCEAVVKKARLDVAVQQGRCAMGNLLKFNEKWRSANTDPSIGQWSLPTLFSCAPTQILFTENTHNSLLLKEKRESAIKLRDVFIGRRQELRILTEQLSQGKIRRLLIHGEAGIGKSAFAGRLVKNLENFNYKRINHQVKLADFSTIKNQLKQGKWLFCFDDAHNLHENILSNMILASHSDNLLILLISLRSMPELNDFYNYELAPPHFNDFCHYADYLGLSYETLELDLIYKTLNGNFKGLQLLQTIQSVKTLEKQLAIVKRYLVAYSREA